MNFNTVLKLGQVRDAINNAGNSTERDSLLSLKDDLEELLSLTRENLDTLKRPGQNERINQDTVVIKRQVENRREEQSKQEDPLKDEYELFTAELAALEEGKNSAGLTEVGGNNLSSKVYPSNEDKLEDTDDVDDDDDDDEDEETDLQSDFNSLLGSKCQAPHVNRTGASSYHNALISAVEANGSVSDISDIKVRVLFTNPTEKEMIPCRYFLDNKCNFGEARCKYSHGNLVPLPLLQEYKEPDFKLIKAGCRVLVRTEDDDGLWKSAVVEDVVSDETCVVKVGGRFTEVAVHDILPLTESSSQGVDGDLDLSDTDGSEDDSNVRLKEAQMEAFVEMSLTKEEQSSTKLGEWEKYTKGIGSRLMAKMGYVVGCGLGKEGEGRLDPVEAVVLPAGKSLDHCMNLKEAAGGSKDLFSAERIQKKIALKELRKSKRRYANQKRQENNDKKHNVFNIINKLSSSGGNGHPKGNKRNMNFPHKKLSESSGRQLNVQRLTLEENMRCTKRDIFVLEESLTRHKAGTSTYSKLNEKLRAAYKQLASLQAADDTVAREQDMRHNKRKMTVF